MAPEGKVVDADERGRISLGGKYRQKRFLIYEHDDGHIVLEPAVTMTMGEYQQMLQGD